MFLRLPLQFKKKNRLTDFHFFFYMMSLIKFVFRRRLYGKPSVFTKCFNRTEFIRKDFVEFSNVRLNRHFVYLSFPFFFIFKSKIGRNFNEEIMSKFEIKNFPLV